MATAGHTLRVLDGWVEMLQSQRRLVDGLTMNGRLYCPRCVADRLVDVHVLCHRHVQPPGVLPPEERGVRFAHEVPLAAERAKEWLVPSTFLAKCRQCGTGFTALIYRGANGPSLAVFPECAGGLATPRTPPAVAYYLDQAARAQSAGAYTAAMGMFRAALDQLLLDQGFEGRTCGQKIGALEKAVAEGRGPAWVKDLDDQYLKVLKELGDGALHADASEISRLLHLDEALVSQIETTFAELLEAAYEAPSRRKERLASLEAARAEVKPTR
jgi:hypothetical protein